MEKQRAGCDAAGQRGLLGRQTCHADGANTTPGAPRPGVLLRFCAGWCRARENFIAALGTEKAETFPQDLQNLLGFRMSKGGLGHVFTANPPSPLQARIKARDPKNRVDPGPDPPPPPAPEEVPGRNSSAAAGAGAPMKPLDLDVALAEIRTKGYFIAERVLEPAFCDELRSEIDRLEREKVPLNLRNPAHGYKTQRWHDLLNYGEVWQRLPMHAAILPVVQGLLGADCLLDTYGTAVIGPGEGAQQIHVDDSLLCSHSPALRLRPRRPAAGGGRDPIVVNAMVAVSNFTAENGATNLVPRSHLLDYPSADMEDLGARLRLDPAADWLVGSVPAVMPRGSVAFWDGQLYHGGGANRTADQRRYGIAMLFNAGYLRTQENFIASLGEKALIFPEDLQGLIGYRSSQGGLGRVHSGGLDDPLGLEEENPSGEGRSRL